MTMITGHEMIFALIACVVAASLFLGIFGFVVRTLRRAKTKKNPDYEALATILKDMELSGLIKLKSGEGEKPAIKGTRQAEDQHNKSKKAA
jgi:hypothetical protein